MIFDYIITLKRPNYKWIDMISHLLLFISVVSFGMFFFETKNDYKYLGFCLVVTAFWVYSILQKRKNGSTLFRFALLLSAAGWLMQPYQNILFVVLYAIAGLLEKQVKFPQEIGFAEEIIVFNSFPKKRYNWDEILNVVLKDNLLTVDFKNNKLIQKEIDEEVSTHVEVEFNEFCKQQMSREAGSRSR